MRLSPTFRKRFSADGRKPHRQFDWSAISKKWIGPLAAYRPELTLLPAKVKPQSLVTVDAAFYSIYSLDYKMSTTYCNKMQKISAMPT